MAGLAFMAPYIFGFGQVTRARLVMQVQAVAVLVQSLLTNYEWGALRSE